MYIVKISKEKLTEYEMSRQYPKTFIKGVTGIKRDGMYVYGERITAELDDFGKKIGPIEIVCDFEMGKDFTDDQVSAILARGNELGLELATMTKEEAESVISRDPSAGKIELCRQRMSALISTPDDGDETPFTR